MELPRIVPITDLRKDSAAVLESVRAGKHPVVITQRGHAAAVLMSVKSYERMMYEREVLGILVKGETEIQAAKGIRVEDILAEMDALLGKGS